MDDKHDHNLEDYLLRIVKAFPGGPTAAHQVVL